ncbi:ComEA family DNA-binding protein [Paenalcaligenes sp. Me131]|uniref:ComEA family DNA-binding protein n=1 Tax=Paenalcaligenes sp. Me131 TaxID=3392636 RepID=UPI003D2CECCA
MMTSLAISPRFSSLCSAVSRGAIALLLCLSLWGFSALAWAVNVNTATDEQLQQIKGIGPKTAALIMEERERGGPFVDFQDLQERVKGIGAKRAQSLEQGGLTVQGSESATPATAR